MKSRIRSDGRSGNESDETAHPSEKTVELLNTSILSIGFAAYKAEEVVGK